MVSGLSIAFFVLNIILGIAFPTVLFIYFKKKYGCSFIPFLVGVGTFFVFSMVLESLVHALVLSSPLYDVFQNNIWLYALYGGLMAGIFEETGRFLAMKLLLKKHYANDHNALMYGAGHGGFEAFALLTMTYISNIIYAVIINSGLEQTILDTAPSEELAAQVQGIFDTLINTQPTLFLAASVERIPAIAFHLALSVIVWFAVTRPGKIWMFPAAIILHAVYDAAAVIINSVGSVLITELFVFAGAAVVCFAAYRLWTANKSKGQ